MKDPVITEGLTRRRDIVAAVEHFLSFELCRTGEDDIETVDVTDKMPRERFGVVKNHGRSGVTVVVHPGDLRNMDAAYRSGNIQHGIRLARMADWGHRPVQKEAAVAGDIQVKRFTRERVEYWIPTGRFDGEGGRFEDLGVAHAWAVQELVVKGVIEEGSSAEGRVFVKPSDEHVIVFVEFDEEQG